MKVRYVFLEKAMAIHGLEELVSEGHLDGGGLVLFKEWLEKLGAKSGIKFSFLLAACLSKEAVELILVAGFGEHKHLNYDASCMARMGGLLTVNSRKEEGGGYVKLEDGKLVFFGASSGLGSYDEETLRRAENSLKEDFNVSEVEYQTDYCK